MGRSPSAGGIGGVPAAAGTPWILTAAAGATVTVVALAGLRPVMVALGLLLQVTFLVFFLRHLAFAVAALRTARHDLDAPGVDGPTPPVSVLVACKDEEQVVDGLVTSLLALDYPADRLQVLVVDDGSTDGTGARLEARAADEPRLAVVRRAPGSDGGKSAALNEGLALATGEVIVVFDADHQPHADVLRRLVRHFADPGVAAVQGRCRIRNASDSPLTRLIHLDYLSGYLVNEYGRQALFHLPAYGGANCAVRASELRRLGGWNTDSVTEDTDLTLRLVLSGRRVRYDVTAVDEEEGVVTLGRYWRQRYRWARGHQQAWRDYRLAVWRSPALSRLEKLETTMFLFVFHLPVFSGLGVVILLAWASGLAPTGDPLNMFVLWTLLFVGPLFELSAGLLVARADRREALRLPFFLPLFFISIALCTKAWIDGVLGREYAWVKTRRSADPAPAPAGAA